MAQGAGVSWRTIERAKNNAGVKAHKQGFTGKWLWEIPRPPDSEDSPRAQNVAVFGEGGGLRENMRVSEGSEGRHNTEGRQDRQPGGTGGLRGGLGQNEEELDPEFDALFPPLDAQEANQ